MLSTSLHFAVREHDWRGNRSTDPLQFWKTHASEHRGKKDGSTAFVVEHEVGGGRCEGKEAHPVHRVAERSEVEPCVRYLRECDVRVCAGDIDVCLARARSAKAGDRECVGR